MGADFQDHKARNQQPRTEEITLLVLNKPKSCSTCDTHKQFNTLALLNIQTSKRNSDYSGEAICGQIATHLCTQVCHFV